MQQNTEAPATNCKHKFVHHEDNRIYCILCHWMVIDIKGMTIPFASEHPGKGSRKNLLSDGRNGLCFDEAQFGVQESGYSNKEGTVWDLTSADTKQNMDWKDSNDHRVPSDVLESVSRLPSQHYCSC
ncbi:hypothetical protein HN51_027673 [Arachis hypogaea]